MSISLTLPLPPSANRYWRSSGGRVYVSTEAKDYKAHVAQLCNVRQIEPLTCDVQVVLDVYRARKAGDLDNWIKVALDSLNGYCYLDDKQIIGINAHRFDDKANPRIEILVSPWRVYEHRIPAAPPKTLDEIPF